MFHRFELCFANVPIGRAQHQGAVVFHLDDGRFKGFVGGGVAIGVEAFATVERGMIAGREVGILAVFNPPIILVEGR